MLIFAMIFLFEGDSSWLIEDLGLDLHKLNYLEFILNLFSVFHVSLENNVCFCCILQILSGDFFLFVCFVVLFYFFNL